jgi:hypothetical protein
MHQRRVEPMQWQLRTKLAVTKEPRANSAPPTASVCCPRVRSRTGFLHRALFRGKSRARRSWDDSSCSDQCTSLCLAPEIVPFLHQIVARCSLIVKTGLLRHVRYVRRLTTGADIEVRLSRRRPAGTRRRSARTELLRKTPDAAHPRCIPLMARSVVGRKRRRCQNGQGDNNACHCFQRLRLNPFRNPKTGNFLRTIFN